MSFQLTLKVQLSGLNVQKFGTALHEILPKAIGDIGDAVASDVRAEAPVRTGVLRSSVTVDKQGLVATIYPTVPYGIFVELGTRPHIIRPRFAKVLAFVPFGGTRSVFSAYVHHPGTRPNPFIERGVTAAQMVISEIINEAILEAERGST